MVDGRTPAMRNHGGKKRKTEELEPTAIWKKQDYSEDMVGLHQEINDFFEYIRPTEEEAKMRAYVVDQLKDYVSQMEGSMELQIFGSYATDLYLPTSDIDVVLLGNCPSVPQCLYTLHDGLIEKGIADPRTV